MVSAHWKALVKQADDAGLDLLIASSVENVRYASGFLSAGQKLTRNAKLFVLMQPQGGAPKYIMPIADLPSAHEVGIDLDRVFAYGDFHLAFDEESTASIVPAVREAIKNVTSGPYAALIGQIQASGSARRIGIDFAGLDGGAVETLRAALPGRDIVDAADIFFETRKIKDAAEIAALERATIIAEEAALETFRQLREGMSEMDAVRLYQLEVVKRGAENSFAVFTFGERAAFVDTCPSQKNLLRVGTMIRADFGCTVEGYHADMARMAVLGKPSDKLRAACDAVWEGEQAGLEKIKPGVSFAELFLVFEQGVRTHGLSQYRRNHCGHGIGLAVSEPPHIRASNVQVLEGGMTLCVETPYYELGWGGVQIEDTLLITSNGFQLFQKNRPSLFII